MRPIFVNWRKAHLKRTVRIEDFSIKAKNSEFLPYLELRCFIYNGSETKIEIQRTYGSVYVGDCKIATFNISDIVTKNPMTNRNQYLTIKEKIINRGNKSEMQFNFSPPIDFWLLSKDTCSIGDGEIQIKGGGVNVLMPLMKDNLPIEEIKQVRDAYKAELRKRLSTILGEKNG